MRYQLSWDLPLAVHGVEYMRNSHFIELTDAQGRRTRVVASGVLLFVCEDCDTQFFLMSNLGPMHCPRCKSPRTKSQWVVPQTAFVPERESDFRGGFPHEQAGIAGNGKDR